MVIRHIWRYRAEKNVRTTFLQYIHFYTPGAIHFLPKPALSHTAKDSQKIKIKKKTKTPRITDEGWNSQKWLSDPVEKKMKEGRKDSCIFISKAHFRFSSPIGSFTE